MDWDSSGAVEMLTGSFLLLLHQIFQSTMEASVERVRFPKPVLLGMSNRYRRRTIRIELRRKLSPSIVSPELRRKPLPGLRWHLRRLARFRLKTASRKHTPDRSLWSIWTFVVPRMQETSPESWLAADNVPAEQVFPRSSNRSPRDDARRNSISRARIQLPVRRKSWAFPVRACMQSRRVSS